MRRWHLVVLGVVVLLVGGRFIYGIATRVDDKTAILRALADAIKASKEGRPGGVVDKLAENFKVNDMQASSRQVADFVKNQHPEVEIADTDPIVSSDTAQLTSDVNVKIGLLGNTTGYTFKDAQILFIKEPAMDWLIIPTSRWRLSAVRVKPEDMPTIPYP